jgi:hypothetical protein
MSRVQSVMALALGILFSACTGGKPMVEGSLSHPTTREVIAGVPDVVGLNTEQAVVLLDRAGLHFQIRAIGGRSPTVVRQLPLPGAPAEPGTVVTMDASCYPAPCPFPGEEKAVYDPCTCASR